MDKKAKEKKQVRKTSYRWLLLSFFAPLVIATTGYHFVYVSDASVRSMGLEQQYPGIAIEKAIEIEEGKRIRDFSAWLTHALVLGLPSGIVVSLVVAVVRGTIRFRTRDDVA